MKQNVFVVAVAVLAFAGIAGAAEKTEKRKEQPKEYWCVGPVEVVDAASNQLTIQVKESGVSSQTPSSGQMRLGKFTVAAGSAASEVLRTFACAPGCQVVTKEKPGGATLGDLRPGESVRVTYNETGNGYVALQVAPHVPVVVKEKP
jgi:hypothetical protein